MMMKRGREGVIQRSKCPLLFPIQFTKYIKQQIKKENGNKQARIFIWLGIFLVHNIFLALLVSQK